MSDFKSLAIKVNVGWPHIGNGRRNDPINHALCLALAAHIVWPFECDGHRITVHGFGRHFPIHCVLPAVAEKFWTAFNEDVASLRPDGTTTHTKAFPFTFKIHLPEVIVVQ